MGSARQCELDRWPTPTLNASAYRLPNWSTGSTTNSWPFLVSMHHLELPSPTFPHCDNSPGSLPTCHACFKTHVPPGAHTENDKAQLSATRTRRSSTSNNSASTILTLSIELPHFFDHLAKLAARLSRFSRHWGTFASIVQEIGRRRVVNLWAHLSTSLLIFSCPVPRV